MKKLLHVALIICIGSTLFAGGCIKKYDKPEYVDVKSNETAYVIPLEGDTTKQAKFSSVAMLDEAKVAAKRIRITHRWNQTGRMGSTGDWIANVMVVKVNRSPVTREWSADSEKGTSRKDEGIWAESKDSVGFSTGITITAMVLEEDTSLFLYRYQSQQLSAVMDTEIRGRLQASFSDFAGGYDMSALRAKKSEIMAQIRSDLIPFFKERGITITTVGQFGGFSYENAAVQASIDSVFIAQREKDIAAARLEAQNDINARLEMEGIGIAKKLREEAVGKKDAAITAAEGEAQAIEMVNVASKKAASNPLFLQLQVLQVQQQQIAQWDGKFPAYYMGTSGSSPSMLLQVPAPK